MAGVLYPEEEPVVGALTVNPILARQFAKQRAANPRPELLPSFARSWDQYPLSGLASQFPVPNVPLSDPQYMEKTAGVRQSAMDLAMGIGTGLTAFHGSPHRFSKFDMSKVGTGEGAQAYGHGLYFAENPAVAKGYRDVLTTTAAKGDDVGAAFNYVQKLGGDADYAKSVLQEQIQSLRANNPYSPNIQSAEGMLKAIESGAYKSHKPPQGALYKVDLPDDQVAKMLDWDKPLSQQPESVRSALGKLKQSSGKTERFFDPFAGREMTGMQLYRTLSTQLGEDGAAKVMRDAGVPGIKYLDQGSRGSGVGTSNFVVFDDRIPKILSVE